MMGGKGSKYYFRGVPEGVDGVDEVSLALITTFCFCFDVFLASPLFWAHNQPSFLCHISKFTIHEGGWRDEWLSQVSVTTFTVMRLMREAKMRRKKNEGCVSWVERDGDVRPSD